MVTKRVRTPTALALLLLAAGCGDDGAAEGDGSDTGDAGSEAGGSSEATPTSSSGSEGPDTGESGDTSPPVEVGPHFGVLTFTYYPADASGAPELLGLAAAWRTEPSATDDFYAVRAFDQFFPPAPADVDALARSAPAVYDWGKPDAWVALGNGVRLAGGAGEDPLACLQVYRGEYPLYLADAAEFIDPACAPDPARWQAGAAYDLVVYGGDMFEDSDVAGAVVTPTALVVTAPDLTGFDFPLDRTRDLELAWEPGDADHERVVVRLWDRDGVMLTAHAADDGAYTIPAAELAALATGAVTLTVARERVADLGLLPGRLRVVARHELWAYPDLF